MIDNHNHEDYQHVQNMTSLSRDVEVNNDV